jgi:hypothetical protein
MSGKTMKLLRKTASQSQASYKLLKRAYVASPEPLRRQGKAMMRDIVEVEHQQTALAKNPNVKFLRDLRHEQAA